MPLGEGVLDGILKLLAEVSAAAGRAGVLGIDLGDHDGGPVASLLFDEAHAHIQQPGTWRSLYDGLNVLAHADLDAVPP